MLGNNEYGINCLKSLKGRIHIILGNHDTDTRIKMYKECPNVVEVVEGKRLKAGKLNFYLTHYPTLTSNYDSNKSLKHITINLCGHCHTLDKWSDWDKGTIYHVELEAHNCFPVNIEDIIKDLYQKRGY